MMNLDPALNDTRDGRRTVRANRVGIVRLTIGRCLCGSFLRTWGRGAYTPAGYAGVINYYIRGVTHRPRGSHHGFMASTPPWRLDAAMTEISLESCWSSVCSSRPVAFVAFGFLASLWVSEWGTSWIWELLTRYSHACASVGSAGRTWGVDGWLARRWPVSPWW